MTTRTFNQYGVSFGSSPTNITAKIDNVVVYEGPVQTLSEPFPVLPNTAYTVTNTLFSWTAPVDFAGPLTMEVTTNGALLLAQLDANYTPMGNVGNVISSGPNSFVNFQSDQFGNTYINDTLQTVTHGDLIGMWWWSLAAGDTFVENFTIEPGLE